MLVQGFITECSPLEKSGVVRVGEYGVFSFRKSDLFCDYAPAMGDRVQLEVVFTSGCRGKNRQLRLMRPIQLVARADLIPNSDCG